MNLATLLARLEPVCWAGLKEEPRIRNRARAVVDLLGPDLPCSDLGPDHLLALVAQLKERGLELATVNHYLNALGKLLATGFDLGLLDAEPPKVPRFRIRPTKHRVLSSEEEHQLLTALERMSLLECRALVALLVDTGLRVGEALALRPESVDLERGCLTVESSKNGDSRVVPLTTRAMAALREVSCWFQSPQRTLSHQLRRAVIAAGLSDVTFHTLRHTCCTRLIERGISTPVVQRWMGHRDVETTMRYTHVGDQAVMLAVGALEAAE